MPRKTVKKEKKDQAAPAQQIDEGFEPREQTADPRAGGITRFPLRFINREDSPVAMDLILTVPGDDYRLHWPGSDRQERVYRVKGHVQSPGTGEKEIKIEIPPSVDGEVGSAHLVAIAQRDHLYGRRDSSCVGSRDPGKLELWSEENRFRFPSVRDGLSREQFDGILERIVRRRRSGGKGETVPVVEILAKEMGIPRKRLLHILEDNPVFSLEDVPVKGGFLGLRTVKGHEIRLSNTEECIAGLSSDAPGTISEFALNPVAAVRMISVLAKRLNSLPAVRGGAGRRIVHTPAPPASIQDHGKDERHGETGKGKDEKMLRELRRKRGESITVGGNDYNTLEGLLRALLELGSPELLELASRDHFGRSLSESEGERILGGIFIYLRTRIHLGEIREADIKGELFSRLLDTPLGEPFFEDVLMPKIRSLTRVTTGDATRLLEEVRVAGRRYAPSALSDIIFSLDREIRPLVMRVLGELGDERAMPSLQKMLETSVEREDRIAAMEALLELNTSDSRDIARSAAAGDAELHEVAARRGLTIADKVESDEKKVLLD